MSTAAVASALSVLLAACSADGEAEKAASSAPQRSGGIPVVIDGDADSAELMAHLYLLSRPEVDVRAITINGAGASHCPQGAENIAGVVERLGMDVPVACGATEPLDGFNAMPTHWRVAADDLAGITLPHGAVSDLAAPNLMARAIQESPAKVQLITLGPLTNVALALTEHPGLADKVGMITIMGGAIDVAGNTDRNPNAEWNIWVDPTAAQVVLDSGAPITLVPLDATNHAPISVVFPDVLEENRTTEAARILYELAVSDPTLAGPGRYFWDPLAAAIALDSSLATLETRRIAISGGERDVAGRTVADPSGAEVQVATSADGPRFQDDFLSTLNDGAEVHFEEPDPDALVSFDGTECRSTIPRSWAPGRRLLRIQIDESMSFVLGTYKEGFGRRDLVAHAKTATDVGAPAFVNIVQIFDGQGTGESLDGIVLEPGRYFAVCLQWPSTTVVLPDLVIEG